MRPLRVIVAGKLENAMLRVPDAVNNLILQRRRMNSDPVPRNGHQSLESGL
jgi:hypothetical protein